VRWIIAFIDLPEIFVFDFLGQEIPEFNKKIIKRFKKEERGGKGSYPKRELERIEISNMLKL